MGFLSSALISILMYVIKIVIPLLFLISFFQKTNLYKSIKGYEPKNLILYNSSLFLIIVTIIILLEKFNVRKLYIGVFALLLFELLLKGSIIIKLPESKYSCMYDILMLIPMILMIFIIGNLPNSLSLYVMLIFIITIERVCLDYNEN